MVLRRLYGEGPERALSYISSDVIGCREKQGRMHNFPFSLVGSYLSLMSCDVTQDKLLAAGGTRLLCKGGDISWRGLIHSQTDTRQ